jgi:hypothetical protein
VETSSLPPDFLDFYSIHDGWTLFFHPESGPLPSREWFLLADHKEPDLVAKVRRNINPEKFLVVSEFAGDGLLGFNLSRVPSPCYICWKDFPIEVVPDVWMRFDEEIGEFLEKMNPV